MTTIMQELILPDDPRFDRHCFGKHRPPVTNPTIDARAYELLRSAVANKLDRKILSLLDSEDPSERSIGVDLAEIAIAAIADKERAQQAQKREAEIAREAMRQAGLWEEHRYGTAFKNAMPLFVTLCLLYEYCSQEKRDEVQAVIMRYDNRELTDAYDVRVWMSAAKRTIVYLERRQNIVEQRRAAKAERAPAEPPPTPGVDWKKQASITTSPASYLAERMMARVPSRGSTIAGKRNGDGTKKR